MTLLKDLVTVFFSLYGFTNSETRFLINVLNYYHEYEEKLHEVQWFTYYNVYDKTTISIPKQVMYV